MLYSILFFISKELFLLVYIRTFCLIALLPFSLHANPVVQDQIHKSAVVFVYHRFGESKYPSTNIKLEQFQEQLDYLESNNYNVVKLSTIIEHIKAKKPLPPKSVALTMDDAYYSVYTNAYPMLKAKGYPFSVFVNTNPIDNGSKNYVTWDQMREMQKNGGEFFNHSLRHDYLLTMQDETQEQAKERITKDILQAQKRLDSELGESNLKVLAYPFGEYDLQTKEILRSLEFIGVAQNSGPMGLSSDPQALTRFPMAELFAKMAGFKTKLNTLEFPLKSITPTSPLLGAQNPPKLILELQEPLRGVSCFLSSGEKIDLKWLSKTSFEVSANKPLKGQRDLYTCTAPAKDGKWYWYSHLWIIAKR